jgi:hypothetical protein
MEGSLREMPLFVEMWLAFVSMRIASVPRTYPAKQTFSACSFILALLNL